MIRRELHRSGLLIGRLAYWVARFVLFLVLLDTLLFCLFDLLPEAPLLQLGLFGADPILLAEARAHMGLDGPWYARLAGHWRNLGHLDLGTSLVGRFDILDTVRSRLSRSSPLWVGSVAILILLPIPLATTFATRKLNRLHRTALWLAQLAAFPQFLAAMALYVLAFWLSNSAGELSSSLRWLLATVSCALLPFTMLFVAAANTFHTCAKQRYVDTYLALGMSWWEIRLHLLRNVLGAVRPLASRAVLGLATGTIFAEIMFGIPGWGQLFVDALRTSDLNVMRVWILIVGSAVLLMTGVERARP